MKKSAIPKKFKWITQALFLSGILNVLLVLIFFYFILKDRPLSSYFEYKPNQENSVTHPFSETLFNVQLVRTFQSMSYEQLVEKLQEKKIIEYGYAERDLALACLVKKYYFNIDRALNGKQVQERQLGYATQGEKKKITIFAGLTEEDFEQIIHFIQTEKWPLTSQGLFLQLKSNPKNLTLVQAFCQTPEFIAVETLFSRAAIPIKKRTLLKLITEGCWESLTSFNQSQKMTQDFSPARRQCFLLDYIGQKSQIAAYLIVMTDRLYAEKRLEDIQVCQILELLNEKTAEAWLFAKEILAGPRSDQVHQLAAKRLYQYSNESFPEPFNKEMALTKFCPEIFERQKQVDDDKIAQEIAREKILKKLPETLEIPSQQLDLDPSKQTAKNVGIGNLRPKFRDRPPSSPSPRLHIIQQGESLWSISRRYKVDVGEIMRYNGLRSDLIKPGKTLKIPPTIIAN